MVTNSKYPAGIFSAIIITGLLVGTLDISAAIIHFNIPTLRNPIVIFKYIACGLVGPETAFGEGYGMAVVGLIAHYCIATIWTALFYLAYPAIRSVLPGKIPSGILFGIVIWMGMNLIVVPLSRIPPSSFKITSALIGCAILIVCVGLPVSIRASKFYD